MYWYQNPLLRTMLSSELKRVNQRIVTLEKTFNKNSEIYKSQTEVLTKGKMSKYQATSGSKQVNKRGGRTIKNPSQSLKVDIRKLNDDITKGNLRLEEVNTLLSRLAGINIDATGNIVKVPQSPGIMTVKDIRKRAKKRLIKEGYDPSVMTDQEIIDEYEEYLAFKNEFTTLYKDVKKDHPDESIIENDPITQRLYGEHREKDEKLTTEELRNIRDRLKELKAEAQANHLKVGEDD